MISKTTKKIPIKQKAVSPLIATILLVAVALSLAGILYSWSSQNAKETTANLTETTSQWSDCSSVNLYIDNCLYDSETGLNLILFDDSQIDIDDNLSLVVIDGDNEIRSSSFLPEFSNSVMSIKTADLSNADDYKDLKEPLQRIRIFLKSCPDRAAITSSCK